MSIIMTKRYYFETEETTTKKKKGFVEVDMDFTQVYKSFREMTPFISSGTSWKLLHWLISDEANKSNVVHTSRIVYEKFAKFLGERNPKAVVSYRAFGDAISELVEANALTRTGKGYYYLNPHFFWSDDKNTRIEFIKAEMQDGKKISYNPSPNKSIAAEPEATYTIKKIKSKKAK